jgi:hypothetical protein
MNKEKVSEGILLVLLVLLCLTIGFAIIYWVAPIVEGIAGIAAIHPLFTVLAVSVAAYLIVKVEMESRFSGILVDLLIFIGFCVFWYFFNRLDGPFTWSISDMGGMCPIQAFWGNHWRSWWTACMATDIAISTALGVIIFHGINEDNIEGKPAKTATAATKKHVLASENKNAMDDKHIFLMKVCQWGKSFLLFTIIAIIVCFMLYGVRNAFDTYDLYRGNSSAMHSGEYEILAK